MPGQEKALERFLRYAAAPLSIVQAIVASEADQIGRLHYAKISTA
jgi:hypothetical protein